MKILLIIALLLLLWQTYSLYWKTGYIFIFRCPSFLREKNTEYDEETRILEDIIGDSNYRMRPDLNGGDNIRRPESFTGIDDSFVPTPIEMSSREPLLNIRKDIPEGVVNRDLFEKWRRQQEGMKEASGKNIPEIIPAEELQDVPERYNTIGYVERENPTKAQGVTFEGLSSMDRVLDGDTTVAPHEQEQAVETMTRLKGTNMERILRARIEGSSENIKRYMDIFITTERQERSTVVDRDENEKDILKRFRIDDIVRQ